MIQVGSFSTQDLFERSTAPNTSHLGKAGKSSTQLCQTVGDMWSFPGGYQYIYILGNGTIFLSRLLNRLGSQTYLKTISLSPFETSAQPSFLEIRRAVLDWNPPWGHLSSLLRQPAGAESEFRRNSPTFTVWCGKSSLKDTRETNKTGLWDSYDRFEDEW